MFPLFLSFILWLIIDFEKLIEYNEFMEKILNVPTGFTVFGLEIKFYGITMALSYALALIVCIILCKKKKYEENLPYKLLLIAFPLAVIGGRLGYVLFDNRTWSFAEILDIRSGGLMLYGGVFVALIGIVTYALIKKQNPIKFMDLIVPCLIIAQALGRWGNFFNQEAYGNLITNPSMQWFPFGVYIEREHFTADAISQLVSAYGNANMSGAWFYATFFYESLWCFLSFFAIYFVYIKTNKVGLATGMYLVLYASERLLVEGVRTDSLYLGSTGIRVSQLISILMIITGVAILAYILIKELKQRQLKMQTAPMADSTEQPVLNAQEVVFNADKVDTTTDTQQSTLELSHANSPDESPHKDNGEKTDDNQTSGTTDKDK